MTTNLANFDSYAGYYSSIISQGQPPPAAFLREYYRMLNMYYTNNGLYDAINEQLREVRVKDTNLKPLRNPARRVVEFYSSKLWPGQLPAALPIEAENDRIVEPIQQVWEWSNFSSRKQRMARWMAIYGDVFLKVNSTDRAVYFSMIKPEYVTDLELDHRGFITYIRLDIPDGEVMHTEVWDKDTLTMQIWRHKQGWDVPLTQLGDPVIVMSFMDTHGEDFVPIVYQPLRDDGLGRGGGAFSGSIDKIDHANRSATRLSQILYRYNKPIFAATANSVDSDGRPMPAPGIPDEITFDDGEIYSMPGNSKLEPLIPNLNYSDALAVLNADMDEIKDDLPELAYYDIREMNQVSGRAVKLLLDDAVSRLEEARGSAETALMRADEMCLSVGQNMGIFSGLGDFNNRDFKHSFTERQILPLDINDKATTLQTLSNLNGDKIQAAVMAGFSEEEAESLFGEEQVGVENEQPDQLQ